MDSTGSLTVTPSSRNTVGTKVQSEVFVFSYQADDGTVDYSDNDSSSDDDKPKFSNSMTDLSFENN